MTEACPLCGNPLGSPDCYRKARIFMDGPPTPTTPLADPIAADDSATPTEESPMPTPTDSPVTVDVTAEVTVP